MWEDDRNWNGSLYFCKNDSRFLVPKKITWMGWTVNFGHPWAPYALVALVALPPLIIAGTSAAAAAARK